MTVIALKPAVEPAPPASRVHPMPQEATTITVLQPAQVGHWSRVSLDLPEAMSLAEWVEVGKQLQSVEHSVMWWIGDWLKFGERRYGSMYTEAVALTGYSEQHLADAKYVAAAYQPSDRSEKVSWTHHKVAAALPALQRQEVLFLAGENEWSKRDLQAEVQRRRLGITAADAALMPQASTGKSGIARRLGTLMRAGFCDWFGIGEARANLLAALFEAKGKPMTNRDLIMAVDSHRPITHGALHEAIHTLRTVFDCEAIDTCEEGYSLTDIGMNECRRALREIGALLAEAGADAVTS